MIQLWLDLLGFYYRTIDATYNNTKVFVHQFCLTISLINYFILIYISYIIFISRVFSFSFLLQINFTRGWKTYQFYENEKHMNERFILKVISLKEISLLCTLSLCLFLKMCLKKWIWGKRKVKMKLSLLRQKW